MNIKRMIGAIERAIALLLRWVGYISGLGAMIGFSANVFQWSSRGPIAFLIQNVQTLWIVAITVTVILLLAWVTRLHTRFIRGYRDKFKRDLRKNWDFEGQWRIPETKTLLVTGPEDPGGITKAGAHWENYTLSFSACIMAECIGVIVRAQDLNNYYMFQIRRDRIRPHRRVSIPFVPVTNTPPNQTSPQIQPVQFHVGWQIFDPPTELSKPLEGWFDVRIIVRGESAHIYINDNLVFQADSFLKIATGKIGFRNHGMEQALVRNVRVTLHE